MAKRVLLIGGTGHFGNRIAHRLAPDADSELLVSSRSSEAAIAKATEVGHGATGIALDQASDSFLRDLKAIAPDIVIHTAGPYQGQDYRVARACIEVGSHYIDLADGREFVGQIRALDREARDRDLLLVSGASTLPGLSSVVVDTYIKEFAQLNAIQLSIAPAHQTPRGYSTASAVLSYCGRPMRVLKNGAWETVFGWQDLKLLRYPEFGRRFGGACDVPDLALFPVRYPGVETVTFHAALEAPWEQWSLWKMAWLTRLKIVRNWDPFVPLFQKMSQWFIRLGSQTGGMLVQLQGTDKGGLNKTLNWTLTAHDNHGPEIPCTPALIIARKLIGGSIDTRGALACEGLFTLEDFDKEMRNFNVQWRSDISQ